MTALIYTQGTVTAGPTLPMRAMVLDISRSLSVLLSQHLQRLQVSTLIQTRGSDALSLLGSTACDLICVDMHLDDMDGTEFITRLRALQRHRETPVLMLTTSDDKDLLAKALRAGVTEVLRKEKLDQVLEYLSDFVLRFRLESNEGRVLYVEDNRPTAVLITDQLSSQGLTVEHVTTAEDALERFRSKSFDLILVDHLLERGMDGLALVQTLRSTHPHPFEVPIMVLSGQEDEKKKVELLRSGANDYLAKTASHEELCVRVRHLIRARRLFDQVRHQQEKLQHLAMTDQLTGLHNRHYLFEAAPQKVSEAQRHQFPVALLIVDLDRFKQINDTHGHATGDTVLKAAAQLLKKSCRREDIVARFGGEEFVILLDHCPQPQALQKAEQMRAALQGLKPEGLPISASIGVRTLSPGDRSSFGELFSQADEAVYQAKENGRNQVILFSVPV